MYRIASEILINAQQVTRQSIGDQYEFILNTELRAIECLKITSVPKGTAHALSGALYILEGMLFELNHVRVNPKMDNMGIIRCLTNALKEIGVQVKNPPPHTAMAVCFKPLGEISDQVRFYLNDKSQLIFLSPATRPRLVYSSSS